MRIMRIVFVCFNFLSCSKYWGYKVSVRIFGYTTSISLQSDKVEELSSFASYWYADTDDALTSLSLLAVDNSWAIFLSGSAYVCVCSAVFLSLCVLLASVIRESWAFPSCLLSCNVKTKCYKQLYTYKIW